jgi:hypothetical protein
MQLRISARGSKYIHIERWGGYLNPLNYFDDSGVTILTWPVAPTMWLVVDSQGNGYEFHSEGFATKLTFAHLRKQPIEDLKPSSTASTPGATPDPPPTIKQPRQNWRGSRFSV